MSALAGASKNIFVVLIILGITWVCFSPTLQSDFVNWDDNVHLTENRQVRSLTWSNIHDIFRSRIGGIYLPLSTLSFAVEYYHFEYDPFIYHLNNLILHLLITALVYALGRRLGLSVLPAFLGSLLFGIHPMHVESVAWVTERKDVLYCFFYLLAMHAYLTYSWSLERGMSGRKRFGWILLITVLGALSLLAKPMAVSLPVVLLLLDWWRKRTFTRSVFWEKVPLVASCLAIGWMTYQVYARIPEAGLFDVILTWCWSFTFHLKAFLFPIYYMPIYRLPLPVGAMNIEYWFSLGVICLLVFALWLFRRYRWFVFAVLFYLFSVFFLLRFDVYDTNAVADRFMYLPSAGFCFWFGVICAKVLTTETAKNFKQIFAGVLVVLFLVLGLRTWLQVRIWQDSFTLWHHQLKIAPREKVALNNLANAYRLTPAFDKLTVHYRKAKREGLVNLDMKADARTYPALALVHELIGMYKTAYEIDADYLPAHYNFAFLYKSLGEVGLAERKYKEYIEMDPFDFEVHLYLGEVYQETGRVQEAIGQYTKAVELAPRWEPLYLEIFENLEHIIKRKEDPYVRQAMKAFVSLYQRNLGKFLIY